MLKRRCSILTLGASLTLIAVLLVGLAFWGGQDAYDWDVARCDVLVDEWYPEIAWIFLIGPMAFVGILVGVVTVWAEWTTRGEWFSWLFLGLTTVLVVGAAVLAVLARFGPCPTAA